MSVCKQCGLPVHWFKDAKGVWKCHDEGTTTDHWDLCSKTRWERTVREGKPFKDKKGEGYEHEGKKKYKHMVAYTKRGVPVKP